MPKRKNILSQMFDVKPVNPDGSLDLGKVKDSQRTVTLPNKKFYERDDSVDNFSKRASILRLADVVRPPAKKQKQQSSFNIPDYFGKKVKSKQATPKTFSSRMRVHRDVENIFINPSPLIPSSFREGKIDEFQPHPESLNHLFESPAETYEQPAEKPKDYYFPPVQAFSEPKKTRRLRKKFSCKKHFRKFKALAGRLRPDFGNLFPKNGHFTPRTNYAYSFAGVLLFFSLAIPAFSFVQKA